MGADHGVHPGARQPFDAGPVRPEAADEVHVDCDELVRGMDLTDERAQRQAVAAKDEEDGCAAGERLVETCLVGDRRAAGIGGHATDEFGCLRWSVGHGFSQAGGTLLRGA